MAVVFHRMMLGSSHFFEFLAGSFKFFKGISWGMSNKQTECNKKPKANEV
jgi:hypothetical protein